jgi:peptide/nickel transport system substrate-binding protein
MRSSFPRLTAGVLALALLAAACGGGGDDEASESTQATDPEATTATTLTPEPGGQLVFGLTLESIGWQPAASLWDPPGYIVAQAIFDRLAAYDADGEIQPYLAEAIEPNDDYTEWTITLRPGVQFHDGTPLDADALVTHFEAMKASLIWGPSLGPAETFEPVGDLEVLVTMSEPFSTFPHLLSAQPGYVASPGTYADPEGATNPVGTGPFVFESWDIGETLSVSRNDNYWREGFPLLDSIEFKVIPDSTERRRALETGDVDIMETNAADDIADLENRLSDWVTYLDTEGEGTEMTALLNTAVLPFSDPNARLAVAHGIDKEGVAADVYAGRFEPANGPFQEGSPWFTGVEFPGFDVDEARRLADLYEEEHGEPITFTIEISLDPFELRVAQEIQSQLERVGIVVDVKSVPAQQTTIDVAVGAFQMNVTNLLWGSQHPDREYFTLHSSNSAPLDEIALAITRMENPTIDAALEESRTTTELGPQVEAWGTVQEELASDSAFIFLVHNEVGEIAEERVKNVLDWTFPDGTAGRPQEQTILSLYQIWIDQ